MKYSFGISNFLEETSSLSHSIVFLYFFALITEKGFLSFLAILWNSAWKWVYLFFPPLLFASLLFTAICKASSHGHFAFLHFFFLWMVSLPVSCMMSWISIHSSSGSLSICRVYRQAGWSSSWNQYYWENYQWYQACSKTTPIVESEEELKNLLMRVKEESEKAFWNLNIQETKIMAPGLSLANRRG